MKKKIFLILYVFGFLLAKAQTSGPADLGPKVVFPSPQASSLGKFGGYAVNHSTGTADITIPVYTATEGDISLPLSFSYYYSGYKPTDEPGWLGLGMALNAGAVITRTQKATGDEVAGLQLQKVKSFVDSPSPVNPYFNDLNLVFDNPYKEHQPDLFSVQGYGLSLRYVLDENGVPKILSDRKVKIAYKKTPYGPEGTHLFTQWEIITEDGTKHIFGAFEVSYAKETDLIHFPSAWYLTEIISPKGNRITFEYSAKDPLKPRIQAGIIDQSAPNESNTITYLNRSLEIHLQKIKGSLWEIDFESSELPIQHINSYASYARKLDYIKVYDKSVSPRSLSRSFEFTYYNVTSFKPSLASFGETGLNPYLFHHSGIASISHNGLSRAVDEWGYANNSSNTSLIPGGTGVNLLPNLSAAMLGALVRIVYPTKGETFIEYQQNDYSTVRNINANGVRKEIIEHSFRFLNRSGIVQHHPNATITLTENTEVDVFNYSGCTSPTSPTSHTLTLPAGSYSGNYFLKLALFAPCGQVFGMCGDPSDPGCGAFVAPEGYDVSIGVRVKRSIAHKKPYYGGIRVKRMTDISNKPGDKPVVRVFDYNRLSDTTYSSGVIPSLPVYDITVVPITSGSSSVRIKRSATFNPASLGSLYYSQVQEKRQDGQTQYNYTWHADKNDTDGKWAFVVDYERDFGIRDYIEMSILAIGDKQTYELFRGLPKQTRVLNKQGQVILNTDITYEGFNTETFRVASLYFERVGRYERSYSSGPGGAMVTATHDLYYGKGFYITGGWPRKSSETTTRYDSTGANPVATVTEFQHGNPQHLQLTRTRTTLSDGSIEEETYKYPLDYATVSGKAAYLQTMIDSNMVNYPIETVKVREYSPTDRRTVQATATTYKLFSGNPAKTSLVLPYKYFGYYGEGAFTPYGGLETPSASYMEQAAAVNYSLRGNLLYSHRNGGLADKTAYLWGYKGQHPVAEIRNADFAQLTAAATTAGTTLQALEESTDTGFIRDKLTLIRTALPHAALQNYLYRPNFGPVEQQDETGLTTRYEYDVNARLKRIRNHQDSLISSYAYYQTQTGYYADYNYIQTAQYREGALSENLSKAMVSYRFTDGLNRDRQTLLHKYSPLLKDIYTQTTTYDSTGRAEQVLLPVSTGNQSGSISLSINTLAAGFYSDSRPYSSYTYDALDRTVKTFGPGQAWGNRSINTAYGTTAADVKFYKASSTDITLSGNYPAGSTYLTRSTNEQGNVSMEITDKTGNILEKRILTDAAVWAVTAYIYDDALRLKAVIQPEGYALNAAIAYNSEDFKKYVFYYEYDKHSRIIRKHIPGAGWTDMVYDRADRTVMTQDAAQKVVNRWSFTQYDALNREIVKGEMKSSMSRADIQTLFNAQSVIHEQVDYTAVAASVSAASFAETELPTLMSLSATGGQSFPAVLLPATEDLRAEYYYDTDILMNYSAYWGLDAPKTNAKGLLTAIKKYDHQGSWRKNAYWDFYYYNALNRMVQSHHTQQTSRSPFVDLVIKSYAYNFAGQVIKEQSYYPLQYGVPINKEHVIKRNFYYDHAGRHTQTDYVRYNYREFINGVLIDKQPLPLIRYTYDEIGRLKQKIFLGDITGLAQQDYILRPPSPTPHTRDYARKAVILQPGTEISATAINTYVAEIKPGGTTDAALQIMDYTWHIRGGLRGINLTTAGNPVPDATQNDLLAYKLDYETAGQWSGNIGRQSWNHLNGTTPAGIRSYLYAYDGGDRLKSAIYSGIGSENYSTQNVNYDRNGNILSLHRKGKVSGSAFGDIDVLNYTYSGNRLNAVSDAVSGNENTGDFRAGGSGAYTYYENGALKSDANKGVNLIEHDTFLKKITKVTYANGNWIQFTYNGGGDLLKRESSNGEYWEHIDEITLKNGIQYSITIPEGRTVWEDSTWKYEFEYRDVWNNLRVSFRDENGVAVKHQQADYDSYGYTYNNENSSVPSLHKYQSQERIEDFGLNIDFFKYRPSDPTIGRFWSGVDPLAEQFYYNSPYALQENKFGLGVELEGAEMVGFAEIQMMYYKAKDWLTNTGVGRSLQGAQQYVRNEDKQRSDVGYNANVPSGIRDLQHRTGKASAINEMVKGGVETMDRITTATGLALGGIEGTMGPTISSQALKGGIENISSQGGLQLDKSVISVIGKNYSSVGEVTAPIKNTELLNKLNVTSKGDWVKVYEAGVQNGGKIETHYFRNNNTKEVFDVKTKYDYWHQKSFKKLDQ